ncbi:MAG: Bax inhibitor-1/YccA family protein, partial [Candidatus Izimaplasma sp.]|nr:Bax inhibitor-1/YccA family protein [Candidatus Izimaplasma bacterium]
AVLVTHRKPELGMFTTLLYAGAEGTFIGFVSAMFAYIYGGEIIQMALMGTFGVLGGMLFLYSTGIIRVGNFFKKFMISALIGLIFASLLLFILSFSGIAAATFETLYVGIVVLSVIISSLFLLYDFNMITEFVDAGAPKAMEWSLALGLVVTIVWLYLELLRLFAIIAGKRD